VGFDVGDVDGDVDGSSVGPLEGDAVGLLVGTLEGEEVGVELGVNVGLDDGPEVGELVGEGVASQSTSGIQGTTNSYEHDPISLGIEQISGTNCESWSISLETIVTTTSANPSEQNASIRDVAENSSTFSNVSHVNSPSEPTN
jgi:hypothetical protein